MNDRTRKNQRHGISILELTRMFPNDDAAMKWFEACRWGDERHCGHCGSVATVVVGGAKRMPYRCKDCRQFFSVKTGTVMQKSKLGYQKWALGIYLLSTSLKGVSSMRMHRDLGITQKSAWLMAHKIREAFTSPLAINTGESIGGEVEIDETYIGGKESNKHSNKKLRAGRGTVGKRVVMGMKQRGGKIVAMPVDSTDKITLQEQIVARVEPDSTIYTDEHGGYVGLKKIFTHKVVKHSVGEYVAGMAHTNGIESFWSLLKRGYHGTYHQMSHKHLGRYVSEFAGRHNVRDWDTLAQMGNVARDMNRKALPYKKLIA